MSLIGSSLPPASFRITVESEPRQRRVARDAEPTTNGTVEQGLSRNTSPILSKHEDAVKQLATAPVVEAISGCFGGLVSSTCTYPLDVIKTRMQVPGSTYTGTLHAFQEIVKEDGLSGLYVGLSSEYLKTAVQNFSYFYWYSALKAYYLLAYNRLYRKRRSLVQPTASIQKFNDTASGAQDEPFSAEELHPDSHVHAGMNRVLSAKSLMAMAEHAERLEQHRLRNSPSPVNLLPVPSGSASPVASPSPPVGDSAATQRAQDSQEVTTISLVPNLLIGCLAGALTQLLVNPLAVVQTRIMTAKKAGSECTGVVDTTLQILRQEGPSTFFNGFVPSLILTTNPAIQFLVFDRLKSYWLRRLKAQNPPRNEMSSMEVFVIGAIAKVVATLITYPYIMAKTRLQFKGGANDVKYKGTLDVLRQVLLREGLFGLYVGLQAQILKSVSGSALLFMAKEKILEVTVNSLQSIRSHLNIH